MEKRVIGFILTLLGIIGLVTAGFYFMRGGDTNTGERLVFFFAGVGLVRGTKDKAT